MTNAPLTVLHVVLRFDKGGLEMTALNLSRELRRQGHRSVVLALDGGGETFDLARSEGIECVALPGRRMASPAFHWGVWRAFRRIKPDVVHTHHFSALLHTLLAGRLSGRFRRVHTEHSRLYLAERPDYHTHLRRASRTVDRFVLVADSMLPMYRDQIGVDASRLTVIVNGVDANRFRPASLQERTELRQPLGLPAGFLVGSVGRLADVKNYPMLLRAVALARRQHPDLHLALIGDGPDRDQLRGLADSLGIGDAVVFLGWQRDPAPVIRALDLFALSSKSEAMPLALLEAMACGLPILATDVGDVTSVVRDANAGIVTEPGDDAAYHAGLLTLIAGDAGPAGSRARAAVERRFSIAAMTDAYFRAYHGDR